MCPGMPWNAFKWTSSFVVTVQMFQNHQRHLWVARLRTLPSCCCLAEHVNIFLLLRALFTATDSLQVTLYITELLNAKELFIIPPSSILLFCLAFLLSHIIHSRAKSQSLSLPFSPCLHGCVSLPHLSSFILISYHLPLCLNLKSGGEENSWRLWCFGEKQRTEWDALRQQALHVCSRSTRGNGGGTTSAVAGLQITICVYDLWKGCKIEIRNLVLSFIPAILSALSSPQLSDCVLHMDSRFPCEPHYCHLAELHYCERAKENPDSKKKK